MSVQLICEKCGAVFEPVQHSYCPRCGGILTVQYGLEEQNRAKRAQHAGHGLWKYRALLPPISDENIVSFQEGGTRLVKSRIIGRSLGLSNLYFKDETQNPTGSFKDRSITVCVSMAKQLGCPGVVVASSGNGAASTSAYGCLGGLDTILFVPETTPLGKVAQAIAYGGKIIRVKGTFTNCYRAAAEMAKEKRYMNATTTFLSPYGIEGYKTIAFEVFEELQAVPDQVFIPVGAGPILYGIWKGFHELIQLGLTNRMPRLICAQAQGCAPISTAWLQRKAVTAWSSPQTVASAICDPLSGYEQDGDFTVRAIDASQGQAYTLSDEEMKNAGQDLARKEGLFVEVSSAASLAALYRMHRDKQLKENSICVCVLTGHGLKDAAAYIPDNYQISTVTTIAELK